MQWIVTPQLHEVHRVAEPETRMAAEDDTRLSIVVTESFGIRRRVMLQTGVLYKKGVRERLLRKVDLALLAR